MKKISNMPQKWASKRMALGRKYRFYWCFGSYIQRRDQRSYLPASFEPTGNRKILSWKIDNKELIYCISLTPKMGNFFINTLLSEISIIVFPYIVGSLAAFVILLVFILYFYFRFIERQFSSELAKLQAYAHKLENLALNTEPVKPCNNNNLIDALENSFYEMHIKLLKKNSCKKVLFNIFLTKWNLLSWL